MAYLGIKKVMLAAGISLETVIDAIYPVGSFYLSANDISPELLFGGVWERVQDCFLLAAGSQYAAGTTGGEAMHTLTESEMPEHYHGELRWATADGEYITLNNGGTGANVLNADWGAGIEGSPIFTGRAGGNQPHNNMPPYLAVYVWKRTA
jgi:hypothetical protein